MSPITQAQVERACFELLKSASTRLPPDVERALRRAFEEETSETGKMNLQAILENVRLAKRQCIPLCQDTGTPIFYFRIGTKADLRADLERAARKAVRDATRLGFLRPSIVHPITRENPGTNLGRGVPWVSYVPLREKDWVEVVLLLKGSGSENMSRFTVLDPALGVEGVKKFVLETVIAAGGKPCPPIIVGIGIGGTSDGAMNLAKLALLRPLGESHPDGSIARLERELMEAINETGIGPMGLGGKVTCIGVKVEYAYTHTASLPVGVNIQCWAARKASVRLRSEGRR